MSPGDAANSPDRVEHRLGRSPGPPVAARDRVGIDRLDATGRSRPGATKLVVRDPTPALIHSSRRRRVVAEQVASAVLR